MTARWLVQSKLSQKISFEFQCPRYVPSIRRSGSPFTRWKIEETGGPSRISGISGRKTRVVTRWTARRRRWQPQSDGLRRRKPPGHKRFSPPLQLLSRWRRRPWDKENDGNSRSGELIFEMMQEALQPLRPRLQEIKREEREACGFGERFLKELTRTAKGEGKLKFARDERRGVKETVEIKPRISQGEPNDIRPRRSHYAFRLRYTYPLSWQTLSRFIPSESAVLQDTRTATEAAKSQLKRMSDRGFRGIFGDCSSWGRASVEPLDAYCR
ncbi:hypothetical protein K0M31_000507 [Melipona bicolor]|uniref:Uncharacterized protein n=1 Tax=Melipona bicolor TaxID=60889 RepID=A0AA40KWW8_9HYME|nr:hypothetical protein K0M31_000507 [Melipona bicolor]